jgi:hypothetical protein
MIMDTLAEEINKVVRSINCAYNVSSAWNSMGPVC